jgi:hypothetical protein
MCIQYGSANKGREEDGSSNVLSSNKIPLASSCHKHNATAVVSFSYCLTPFLMCLSLSIDQYYSSKYSSGFYVKVNADLGLEYTKLGTLFK